MSQARILNKWQRKNMEILAPLTLATLRSGNWQNAPTLILKCVECGGHGISMPIVAYFKYDATKIKCYHCQKKNNN